MDTILKVIKLVKELLTGDDVKIDVEDILYPMEVWKSVALNLFGQQVKITLQ